MPQSLFTSVKSMELENLETIRYGSTDGVAEICLNRPEIKNAVNSTMWRELEFCLDDFASDADKKVLVVTGAGGAFCSGADLSDRSRTVDPPMHRMRKVGEVALKLHRLAKPTIAKVPGIAAGAGCNLAFGCDLIVASDNARFSEIFIKRGLSLDFGGSWLLPRLIGLHKAKELAFFGEVIPAAKALELGLVNRVVGPEELDRVVDEWAQELTLAPPLALSLSKAMLNDSFSMTMAEALEQEARSQAVNLVAEDAVEAIAAFKEKRKPVFKGR